MITAGIAHNSRTVHSKSPVSQQNTIDSSSTPPPVTLSIANVSFNASSGSDHQGKSPSSLSRFEQLLRTSNLPPPGPAYYAARRRLWLKPGCNETPKARPISSSRRKLEAVLSQPNVLYENRTWRKIDKVWRKLSDGTKLSEGLPMCLIIRLVHAAWIRDKTWPIGFEAPEPDDELPPEDDTVSDLQLGSTQRPLPVAITESSDVQLMQWGNNLRN